MGGRATATPSSIEVAMFAGSCGGTDAVAGVGSGVNGSTGRMDAGVEEATVL
jgi:hypothetical protein